MDVGTALSVAQTIFAALQCSELRDFCSSRKYKDDLLKLEKTVETIKAVLLGAEAKRGGLSPEERVYVEELKQAIYDADDLLDEFVTLARRKKLVKVHDLVQYLKKFATDFKMSREVRKIRESLTQITQNHNQFKLEINHQPLLMRRETCSNVCSDDIIGRDADVEKILGMLPNDFSGQRDIFGLTIVGMGGLGKTALAQLVYNHKNVQNKFDLRLWVCVSDQDQKQLNLKEILGKALESVLGRKHDASTLDSVLTQLRDKLQGKSYFLVLDDLWTELRGEWVELEKLLKGVGGFGCVLVTSRSKETAKIIGNEGLMHELGGLSDDDSWHLFKTMAFQEATPSGDLVEIGKEIVKRCKNVPLAIRAMGTLLYGRKKAEWKGVLETGLINIMYEKDGIMPILKLSYDNLEPSLKSCFSYCALFPKDFRIDRKMLIALWMAQGYVMPLREGQHIEAAAELYFEILLRRCFFQDVKHDVLGDIESCKIHDLMHDIAISVSKNEICELNSNMVDSLDGRVLHASVVKNDFINASLISCESRLRTYLQVGECGSMTQVLLERLVSSCTRLRTLDLRGSDFENLPKCIGKLLHLRYLDLSGNKRLKVIPKSITKLHNLFFLGIADCDELSGLPLGMDKLTNLEILERFIVGKASKEVSHFFAELENLKSLNNLKGKLVIDITVPTNGTCLATKEDGCRRGGYLIGKQHLKFVGIVIKGRNGERCKIMEFEEALLEDMQPPSGLLVFGLKGYNGVRMPGWAEPLSFPCLEYLQLVKLAMLKRWKQGSHFSPYFPRLREMEISDCPQMTSIPVCPHVDKLKLKDENRYVKLKILSEDASSSQQPSWKLKTNGVRHLNLIPTENFQCVSEMTIKNDEDVESLSDFRSLFQTASFASIRSLHILYCDKLRSLWGCLEFLTALEELYIKYCPNLFDNNTEGNEDGIPWKEISHSLRSLIICDTGEMVDLPKGMQYLNSLQSLKICNGMKLQSLPEWMHKLHSLTHLEIRRCSTTLERRCRNPTGEDWPNIQHIPDITIPTVNEEMLMSRPC